MSRSFVAYLIAICISGCVESAPETDLAPPTAEQTIVHPVVAQLLSSQPGAPVITIPRPSTDAPLPPPYRFLATFDTTAAVGSMDGPENLVLGGIIDGAIDPDGNVLLLDRAYSLVRVFDSSLRPIRTIGGSGNGPGEFARPASIRGVVSGEFSVVDPGGRRIERIRWGGAGEPVSERIVIPIASVADGCLLGDRIFALGVRLADDPAGALDSPTAIHEIDGNGRVVRSFSTPYALMDDADVAFVVAEGQLHCGDEGPGRIWVGYSLLGEVHALTPEGELLWITRIDDFAYMKHTHRRDASGAFISMGVEPEDRRLVETIALSRASADVLAVQVTTTRRPDPNSRESESTVRTYLLRAADGQVVGSFAGGARILGGSNGEAILYDSEPYPRFVVSR